HGAIQQRWLACTGVQPFRPTKWIRECDETEVDQGQKKREEAMPWQHVANRNAAVQCHLWRDALFGRMQQQLEMKKPARLSGLFEFGSSYWT
ncbi:MAG: hypothetical protein ACRC9Y_17230, partial [Aeromonas veronii]